MKRLVRSKRTRVQRNIRYLAGAASIKFGNRFVRDTVQAVDQV